jgi:hypothetical protein
MQTATGTGNVEITTCSGYFVDNFCVNESEMPEEGKPSMEFPHGFFCFKIVGLALGQTIDITLKLPTPVPTSTECWTCQEDEWYRILLGSNDGDNVITTQLTDGEIGDDDGVENGVIFVRGGLGTPEVKAVPALKLIGILALIGLLSIVLALKIRRKRG